jgi:hypothetical protein
MPAAQQTACAYASWYLDLQESMLCGHRATPTKIDGRSSCFNLETRRGKRMTERINQPSYQTVADSKGVVRAARSGPNAELQPVPTSKPAGFREGANATPDRASPASLLSLQRTIGNLAVGHIVNSDAQRRGSEPAPSAANQ